MSPETKILQLKWHQFQLRLGPRLRPHYEGLPNWLVI